MSRDPKYLLDILIAARKVLQFTSGVTWEGFERDELLQLAVAKLIEIIGEAASKVTPATRRAHPEIPWHDIIGMRHRLIHDYSHVDLEIVWSVVENDMPGLISFIEPLIPPEDEV